MGACSRPQSLVNVWASGQGLALDHRGPYGMTLAVVALAVAVVQHAPVRSRASFRLLSGARGYAHCAGFDRPVRGPDAGFDPAY